MAWTWRQTDTDPAVFSGGDDAGSTATATERQVDDPTLSRWDVAVEVVNTTRPFSFETGWVAGVTDQDRFDAVEPTISPYATDVVEGKASFTRS